MCGIVGLVGLHLPQPAEPLVKSMLEKIAYRGPDGSRVISSPDHHAVFGMNTLSIVPNGGNLGPFSSPHLDLMLTYNGEVYNYRALGNDWHIEDLQKKNDAQVVLEGYEQHGMNWINQLNGMFAFALYDVRSKKVILARDRLGEKPLYYRVRDGHLQFGSEIKALLAYASAEQQVTDEFLAFETPVGDQTLFKDIYLLEPGSFIIYDVQTGKLEKRRYWNLSETKNNASDSSEENLEQLSHLISNAVHLQRPNLPFGLLLSGGVDSSTLAYLMKPDILFTARYPGFPRFDETERASLVAKKLGIEHVFVEPSMHDFMLRIDPMMYHLEYYLGNASGLSEYSIYQAMHERGLKIAVGGIGPDELMLGYVRHLLMLEGPDTLTPELALSYKSLIQLFQERTHESMSFVEKYYELVRRGPHSDAAFLYLASLMERGQDLGKLLTQADLGISFPPLLLTSDKLASAFGIEKRSPYLDFRVVEFMYGLSVKEKVSGGETKKTFCEFAKRSGVPAEVYAAKDKFGFASPVMHWLNNGLSNWSEAHIANLRVRPQLQPLFQNDTSRGQYDRTKFQLLCLALQNGIFMHSN
ncbi:asparagine synthase (glutamine-hydrolyzing) [Candidatus Woesearchaeota archaeon]|nr:asparagine synthase (glutamine-hydrolyzing) [Candidatus Woesearchaeota archaeon]